jgi:4-amino-4-deoxy-L-arabinose transferase-like glycosyltransferase
MLQGLWRKMELVKRRFHPVYFVTVLALFIRFYFLFNIQTTNGDGIFYSWIGMNLAEGYGFTVARGVKLFDVGNVRMPIFPLMLSVFYKVFGAGFHVSKIPSLIFGTLIVPAAYMLSRKIFDKTAGLITALLVCLSPLLSFYSSEILTESIYTFFLLLFLYFLISNGDVKYAAVAGALMGTAYLTRMTGIMLLPTGFLYYLYICKKKFLPYLFSFLLTFALIVAPWFIWSNHAYGTIFTPEKSTAGFQYELEFGEKLQSPIGMYNYLFDYHSKKELYLGFKGGSKKTIKYLVANSFFGYSGVLERETASKNLEFFSKLISFFGVMLFLLGFLMRNKEDRAADLALGSVMFFGVFSPSWQVHLVPWPEPRYVAPLLPLLFIYLGRGLSIVYRSKKPFAIIIMLFFTLSFLFTGKGLTSIEKSHTNISYYYASAQVGIPYDSVIIASNTKILNDLGYPTVHRLGDNDFKGMMELVQKTNARYIIIDSSSIYNQDQMLLLTNWYPDEIPDEFIPLGGPKHKALSYEIKMD